MTLHEPATVLTDFLLAFFAAGLGWRLHTTAPADIPARRWWCRVLALTAFAAALGGTYHGFAPEAAPAIRKVWWFSTLLSLGLVSVALSFSLLHELRPPARQRVWRHLIVSKFAVFAIVAALLPAFVVAIADYGLVLLAWAFAALAGRFPWRHWMLAALALSGLAAAAQQLRWGLGPHLNHNDIYHLIQAVALYAFYRAGRWFGRAAPAGVAQL